MTDAPDQRWQRLRPVLAIAAVAFAIGAIVGAHRGTSPSSALAARFVAAWTQRDYRAMYGDLDPGSQREISPTGFTTVYARALRTATADRLKVRGRPRALAGGAVEVPVTVDTRLFGALSLDFVIPLVHAGEDGPRVLWSRSLAFPGLHPGELLARRTTLPRRAAVLARDGSVLAEPVPGEASGGPAVEVTRGSPLGEAARPLLGTVGPIPSSRLAALEAEGVPPQAIVGLSGLERVLDERLRGVPGGELLAGTRVLASARSRPSPPVRTTISPSLQNAAVAALGGQLGGIVALQPASGQILAVAGIGLDGLQPPGSTFKIVTLTGVLQAKLATPQTVFPYATHATLDGVTLDNANGEECGGSLELAFAVSCNSVFTPLGVRLGASRLVAMAEAFGFNHDAGLAGAPQSTLPAASEIHGELDLGSTAIGQGRVLATPLQMAIVAATVADGGRRPVPRFLPADAPVAVGRVASAAVARTVRRLMTGVVRSGTGRAAAIPGVVVAGKTGTAELKSACPPSTTRPAAGERSERGPREGCAAGESQASNTDAWFAAFAPAIHPRIAVCVLLVKDGAGGDTAAPVARQVLEAGLAALR